MEPSLAKPQERKERRNAVKKNQEGRKRNKRNKKRINHQGEGEGMKRRDEKKRKQCV